MLVTEVERDPDAALVDAFQQGDAGAFDRLVRIYKDRVFAAAYRLMGNAHDAEEVAQEVFIRVYRGLGSFRGESRFKTWLYTILTNTARNKIRDGQRKGRDKGTSLEALREEAPGVLKGRDSTGATPADAARARETEQALQACLNELPEHYRSVFVLRIYEDMSYDEIAETVGCPKGTVKSRLNQARSMLHRRLQELGVM